DGNQYLGLSRSSLNSKVISLWDEKEKKYKNEAGIDAPLKKLFEANFVWADTNPNEEATFGSTSICGNLLKEIVKKFEETDEFKTFSTLFNKTFNDEDSGLKKDLKRIEEKTQDIFLEQFGKAKISFHFDELKTETFFKNTKIEIDDGTPTYMEEKGSGMQRSVALALLHPQAQKKLSNALVEISKSRQVFITTHSPYFINKELLTNVYHFENKEGIKILPTEESKTILIDVNKDFLNTDIREIFFAKKVLCVEGKTDFNRFLIFFSGILDDFSDWTIVKMNSKDEAKKFWKLLRCFCTDFKIILDLDALCGKQKNKLGIESEMNTFKHFFTNDEVQNKIISLGKKNKTELLDSNLTEEEKKVKKIISELLRKEGIFVLQQGEIEDYLDRSGNLIEENKKAELEAIFKQD
ncbi:MAG: hypothetical protein UR89_C0018G0012, partial [Candidatus Roizmanbacteria bacterium GW2011_GWA2_35_8]